MAGDTKTAAAKPKKARKTGGARSAARLGAVQALYQIEMEQKELTLDDVIKQFKEHRLGKTVDDLQFAKADTDFFSDIVKGGWDRRKEWDNTFLMMISEDWTINRLNSLTRAILRCAAYELSARIDVPRGTIINEYLDVAHAFHERSEVSFINGILDKTADKLRGPR